MLEEALEHLVTGIVDHKDDVRVRRKDLRRGEVLEVRVHPDDLGRVIGRSGRTASALRTVMGALAGGRQSASTSSTPTGSADPTSTHGGVCPGGDSPAHPAVRRPTRRASTTGCPREPEHRDRPDRQAARAARRGDRAAAHRRARAPLRRRHGHRRPRPTPGTGVPRALTVRVDPGAQRRLAASAFEEIPDRTGAESLRGTRLVVDAADVLPAPDEDDVFYEERAASASAVVDPARHGARRRSAASSSAPPRTGWSSCCPTAARRRCRSWPRIVPEVDLEAGRVVVDAPPGLLDLGV